MTVTVWGLILDWLAAFSLDKALVVLTSGEGAVAPPDEGLPAVRLPVLGTSCLAIVASVFFGRHFFTSAWLTAALAAFAVAIAQAELSGGWLLARRRRVAYIFWRTTAARYLARFAGSASELRA